MKVKTVYPSQLRKDSFTFGFIALGGQIELLQGSPEDFEKDDRKDRGFVLDNGLAFEFTVNRQRKNTLDLGRLILGVE